MLNEFKEYKDYTDDLEVSYDSKKTVKDISSLYGRVQLENIRNDHGKERLPRPGI